MRISVVARNISFFENKKVIMRSIYCGDVGAKEEGQEVTVAGWVHRRRDHGGVIFVDLRDREGLVQVVFNPENKDIFSEAERIRSEYVLAVKGKVRSRPDGTKNPNMKTGEIEVVATALDTLNDSLTPPFHHDENTNEEIRLKYRYLDLRRDNMQFNLRLRHKVTQALRIFLDENIVIYRKKDGSPAALENACPHRKLPLSKGTLADDNIICAYHGLTFNSEGQCTDSPTQRGMTPRRAVVKSYPVVDRYRLLWIWMGDPKLANPETIFPIENFDNPNWGCTDGGVLDIKCNYLWVCDNLLDPSHVAWVHVTSFAGAGTDAVSYTHLTLPTKA